MVSRQVLYGIKYMNMRCGSVRFMCQLIVLFHIVENLLLNNEFFSLGRP